MDLRRVSALNTQALPELRHFSVTTIYKQITYGGIYNDENIFAKNQTL